MEQRLHPILTGFHLAQATNRITKGALIDCLCFAWFPPVNVDAKYLLRVQVFADLKTRLSFVVS